MKDSANGERSGVDENAEDYSCNDRADAHSD